MKIAVAAEMAPAKALIPVLKKLDPKIEILGLAHGDVEELLQPYCSEIFSIGSGRGSGAKKRSNVQIGYLVIKDILKAVKALKGRKIDLLITCGNAGDVRKGIAAANLLRISTLHIEQDIYNPIEMIALADVITAPSANYKNYLETEYSLKEVHNIQGYPMAIYVDQMDLISEQKIKQQYDADDFILLALGGDIKSEQIPRIIRMVEGLDEKILIVPFRFDQEYVRSLISSPKVSVLDGFVDLPSFMKASKVTIYGAGMGITIEAGVLEVPAIKIAGFHHKHASVDLAEEIGIPVVSISEIPSFISNLVPAEAKTLVVNSKIAVDNLINLIENFEELEKRKGGINSLKKIWKARSEFR